MRSLFQNKNWKWKKENERRWCFFAPSLANTTNNPQHIVYHKNGMFRLQKMENFFFSSLQLTRNKYRLQQVSLEEPSWWYISWICMQLLVWPCRALGNEAKLKKEHARYSTPVLCGTPDLHFWYQAYTRAEDTRKYMRTVGASVADVLPGNVAEDTIGNVADDAAGTVADDTKQRNRKHSRRLGSCCYEVTDSSKSCKFIYSSVRSMHCTLQLFIK